MDQHHHTNARQPTHATAVGMRVDLAPNAWVEAQGLLSPENGVDTCRDPCVNMEVDHKSKCVEIAALVQQARDFASVSAIAQGTMYGPCSATNVEIAALVQQARDFASESAIAQWPC